jgi:hypothetical protein
MRHAKQSVQRNVRVGRNRTFKEKSKKKQDSNLMMAVWIKARKHFKQIKGMEIKHLSNLEGNIGL